MTGTGGDSRGLAWGDYDNDGDLDLAVANTSNEDNYIARNDGGGYFTKVVLTGTDGASQGLAWGDYDNDGDLDLAVANEQNQDTFILRNEGICLCSEWKKPHTLAPVVRTNGYSLAISGVLTGLSGGSSK